MLIAANLSSDESPTPETVLASHEIGVPYIPVPLDVMVVEVKETTTTVMPTTVAPTTEVPTTTTVIEEVLVTKEVAQPNPMPSIEAAIPMSLPEHFETWVDMSECESTYDWNINTGNGFFGGLQFTQESWEAVGGLEDAPRADLATPFQQMNRANKLRKLQGWGAWPDCAEELGLIPA